MADLELKITSAVIWRIAIEFWNAVMICCLVSRLFLFQNLIYEFVSDTIKLASDKESGHEFWPLAQIQWLYLW